MKQLLQHKIFLLIIPLFLSIFANAQKLDSLDNEMPSHPQDIRRVSSFWGDPLKTNRLSFNVLGFVRVVGTMDFGNVQNSSEFIPSLIPIYPNAKEQVPRFFMDARQSRIAFEGKYTLHNKKDFYIYVEADFYDKESRYIKVFRLRHAYAQYSHFLVGQYWSAALNQSALPQQVDLEGPSSVASIRTPQIRYTLNKKHIKIAASVESHLGNYTPYPNIDDNINFQIAPDVIGYFQFHGKWGNIRLTGIYRNISYTDSLNINVEYLNGWGVVFSGYNNFNSRKGIKNKFYYSFVYGQGISNYLIEYNSRLYDAMPNKNNNMEMMPVYGGFIAMKHAWATRLQSNIILGYTKTINANFKNDNLIDETIYSSINLLYTADDRIDIGAEFLYGKKTNQVNDFGEGYRIQLVTVLNF